MMSLSFTIAYNTNLRKSRQQPSGKSAALSCFSRCVVDDDFLELHNIYLFHLLLREHITATRKYRDVRQLSNVQRFDFQKGAF